MIRNKRITIAAVGIMAVMSLQGIISYAGDFADFDAGNMHELPGDEFDEAHTGEKEFYGKDVVPPKENNRPDRITPTVSSIEQPWLKFNEMGLNALGQQNYAAAEKWFKQALKAAEEYAEKNPGQTKLADDISVPDVKPDPLLINNIGIVDSLLNLSRLRHEQGDHGECERLHELAMRYMESITQSRNDPRFADKLPGIAAIYCDHGKIRQAEVLYKDLIRIRQQSYGPDDPRLASALRLYSRFLRKQGRDSEAVIYEHRAENIEAKQYQ
jgi:tetratricopeptide (TPR) repeat protein